MLQHPVLAFDTCGEVGTVALVDLENGVHHVQEDVALQAGSRADYPLMGVVDPCKAIRLSGTARAELMGWSVSSTPTNARLPMIPTSAQAAGMADGSAANMSEPTLNATIIAAAE